MYTNKQEKDLPLQLESRNATVNGISGKGH